MNLPTPRADVPASAHHLDARLDDALPIALALAGAVRHSPEETHRMLAAVTDPAAIMVALAILVPDDRTVADLTAWTHGLPREPVFAAADRIRRQRLDGVA